MVCMMLHVGIEQMSIMIGAVRAATALHTQLRTAVLHRRILYIATWAADVTMVVCVTGLLPSML